MIDLTSEWMRWARLAWFDIVSRYRRTIFGPFWIVILTGITVAAISFVYGSLFGIPIVEFTPYVAIGLISWTWISTTLIESGGAFTNYKYVLLNQPLHPSSVIVRVLVRNWLILLHNAIVVAILLIILRRNFDWTIFLVLPGMLLVGLVVFAASVCTAVSCSRYHDLNQVLAGAMSLAFLVTPIIWSPQVLGTRAYIANLNPFTHLLNLIRLPLMGDIPSISNWLISGCMFLGFTFLAILLLRKYRYQIQFWL